MGPGERRVELGRPPERGLDPQEILGAPEALPQQVAVQVVRVVARAGERSGAGEGIPRLDPLSLPPGEEGQRLVSRGRAGVEGERPAGEIPGLGRPPHPHVEPGPKGERLRLRQASCRPGLLLHLQARHPPAVEEDGAPHVRLDLTVQGLGVPEGLLRRHRRGLAGLEQCSEAVELTLTLVGPQHEIVDERPGLRVEDRGPVLLGVLGRPVRHPEERGQRHRGALPQRLEVIRHVASLVDAVTLDDRVPPELREALVQPGRQRLEVEAEDEVHVLVEDDEVRVVPGVVPLPEPRHVSAQGDPAPVRRVDEDAGGVQGPSLLPELGEQHAKSSLVPHGEDGHRPDGFDARPRPYLLQERPHLLELQEHLPRVLLAPVGRHGEVGAPDLHPRLGCPRERRSQPREQRECDESPHSSHRPSPRTCLGF